MKTTKKSKCLAVGIVATVLTSLAVVPVAFAAPSKTNYIGEAKAQSIALAHAGVKESDTAYIICKLEYDNGFMEYDVEFYVGNMEYDYEINAKTGDVLSYDNDAEYNHTTQPPVSDANNYIGQEKAKSIALKDAGVSVSDIAYIKCEFDYDDGLAEYEVEWKIGKMEYEYTISALDGTIWERDTEYDD